MEILIQNMEGIFKYVLLSLFVIALIRELICWYFKINKRVKLQEKIIKNQERLISVSQITNQYLSEQRADRIFNIND